MVHFDTQPLDSVICTKEKFCLRVSLLSEFLKHVRLVPNPYLFVLKGDERLGRNDTEVAGQAGKGEEKVVDFCPAFP